MNKSYIAFDGTEFECEHECSEYEERLEKMLVLTDSTPKRFNELHDYEWYKIEN